MTESCADPEALARRIRDLRRLAGRADPERFALAVEELAEQVARLPHASGTGVPPDRREPPRPRQAAQTGTNERRLMALARAQARDIEKLEAMLKSRTHLRRRRVGAADDDQLALPLQAYRL
jgi:hypothetical protein